MNFYPFHVWDYAGHTRNLSLLEDLAYRRLLDAYYLAERPLIGCESDVARDIGMRDHVDDVSYVLRKFFTRDGDAWINRRADEEIARYRAKLESASNAGKASAARRRNRCSTVVEKKAADVDESSTDVQLTKNQNQEPEPLPSSLRSEDTNAQGADDDLEPFDVFWTEYPKKVGKGAAQRAWAKIKRPKETLEAMLLALAWQKKSEQWTRDGGQYIPNPATYLNQQRWMDEPPTGRMQRQQQRVHHDISAMDYTRGVDNEGRF